MAISHIESDRVESDRENLERPKITVGDLISYLEEGGKTGPTTHALSVEYGDKPASSAKKPTADQQERKMK
jgi:hypothetical protein